MKNNREKYEEIRELAKQLGLNPTSIEESLAVYPDEFMAVDFHILVENGADEPRQKMAKRTQKQVIKAFNSHDWEKINDIYGHQGLTKTLKCKKCKIP